MERLNSVEVELIIEEEMKEKRWNRIEKLMKRIKEQKVSMEEKKENSQEINFFSTFLFTFRTENEKKKKEKMRKFSNNKQ